MKALQTIALVLVVLVLGGCAISMYSLGDAVNKGDEKAQAFSDARKWIELGMSRSEIQTLAGPPESKQHDVSRFMGRTSTTDYWYYGVLSQDGWQLVFENNRLTTINRG